MKHHVEDGLHLVSCDLGDHSEVFLTATPLAGEIPGELFTRAAAALAPTGAHILAQHVFGCDDESAFHAAFGEPTWPVTHIAHHVPQSPAPGGTQLWAVAGLPVELIRHQGAIVGTAFADRHARYHRFGGLLPPDPTAPNAAQGTALLEHMRALIMERGMDFASVARTWFFFGNILSWYSEFNRTRDAFFETHGIFDGLVPASTGIGGPNPAGAALCSELLAVEPQTADCTLGAVPSPLQCPALDYGSSFSRATEVCTPDYHRLIVSGTASIDAEGRILHPGDMDAQITQTLDVIAAILTSRSMDWSDAVRAIAYVKRAEDLDALARYPVMRDLPAVVVHDHVCFDELLFELEVDAIR